MLVSHGALMQLARVKSHNKLMHDLVILQQTGCFYSNYVMDKYS